MSVFYSIAMGSYVMFNDVHCESGLSECYG
jgi:hypothetical protein